MLKITNCFKQIHFVTRRFSTTSVLREDQKKPKRKVSETVELITLVDQDGKLLGLKPKTESEKLARKLNLSLERMENSKFGKMYPVFQMVSITNLLKTEPKTTAKTLKKLPINQRINDNDLQIKLQTIRKWLAKSHEVHVVIAGKSETSSLTKAVFQKMKDNLKDDSRMLDVREKDGAIKFIVLPPKNNIKKDKVTQTEANKED